MSRTLESHVKLSLYMLCFFIIGFVIGVHYWQIFIRVHCKTSSFRAIRIRYSFYDHFQYRTIKSCRKENSKVFLTIAVLSSYERLLIYLPAIINTWLLETTNEIEIIIFLEEKSFNTEKFLEDLFFRLNQNQQIKSCLYIVKLKYVENNYPPQKKSFYAMKFIYTFYQKRTLWLLRLDDNAYVNIEELIKWLKSVDSRRALYIGQSGSGRQNGPAIHFPPGQYFCMGGSGVILSQQTLIQLGPWLDQCLNNETLTKHEDVELGRCILTHVSISCSNAYNSKILFYHHYGPRYSFSYDFTPSILSQALIVHPIKDQNTFQQIFAFYLREKQKKQDLPYNSSLINRKSYITFLSKIEFDLVRDVHYQPIDSRWKSYIEQTVRSYADNTKVAWQRNALIRTLTNGKFIYGYHRVISSYGLEIIIEILLNAHTISTSSARFTAAVRKRFHIRQPFTTKHRFDYREIINIKTNESIHKLNLIVVSSNKDEALIRLIDNFQREVLNYPFRHKHFTLTILYFSQKNQTTNRIVNLIRQLSVRYISLIRISIIDLQQTSYNRGLGRQLGSKLFTYNQLLFFLDVDLVFTGQALDNTRRLMIHQLAISSCTVYFPIIFSVFSNMFVMENNSIIDVNSKNGLFSIYGFGNVAVRKQDLDRIGGWETNNHDWGVEDVNLFQRFSNPTSECYVFRAVEPGLRHYYHKKMCNAIANRTRQEMCQNADANLLGSQADMMNYILKNKNFTD